MHVHLIFSTKNRECTLSEDFRPGLHAYLSGALSNLECQPEIINSVEDHVHLLFGLGRTIALSKVVQQLKIESSKWMKSRGADFSTFAWQSGYGAFSVSESNLNEVRDYIASQAEHHRNRSFQEEYRAFLMRHNITFDEAYIWD